MPNNIYNEKKPFISRTFLRFQFFLIFDIFVKCSRCLDFRCFFRFATKEFKFSYFDIFMPMIEKHFCHFCPKNFSIYLMRWGRTRGLIFLSYFHHVPRNMILEIRNILDKKIYLFLQMFLFSSRNSYFKIT